MENKTTFLMVLILGILILGFVSFIIPNIPGPANWLMGWTSWIATVVGTAVGVRTFWVAPRLIKNYLESKGQSGQSGQSG